MPDVNDSILETVKKLIGLPEEYTVFDLDIIIHINSVFATLQQLAVGPVQGFAIEDKETKWFDYIGDENALNSVKSYMALKVKLAFDPPATSFAIDSMTKMVSEYEWRLNIYAEGTKTA